MTTLFPVSVSPTMTATTMDTSSSFLNMDINMGNITTEMITKPSSSFSLASTASTSTTVTTASTNGSSNGSSNSNTNSSSEDTTTAIALATMTMQDPPFMLASPVMMVSRGFDIRRVYNSEAALRLSMDVPKVRQDTIVAFVKHSGVPGTLPYVIVAAATATSDSNSNSDDSSSNSNQTTATTTTVYSRKLSLAAECMPYLQQVRATLDSQAAVLEIIAPKKQNTTTTTTISTTNTLAKSKTKKKARFVVSTPPTTYDSSNNSLCYTVDGEPYCEEIKIQRTTQQMV